MSKINKAIIPAAGLGTRFLPLTKAQPKEMLPVVNKPTIQWVVEEAVNAGINNIAIITGNHKKSIENHFSQMPYLEQILESSGKFKELDEIRNINNMANLEFIIQDEPKGLGHAILCAENFIDNEPFAVLLGDTICTGNPNCTKGLVDIFEEKKASVFAVMEVEPDETKRFGIVSGQQLSKDLLLVQSLVEKPSPENAPSLFGILGRYVFTPDILNFQRNVKGGVNSEIQLTDAMQLLANDFKMYSWNFPGGRYDIGTMKDWFQSHIELSLDSDFSDMCEDIIGKL